MLRDSDKINEGSILKAIIGISIPIAIASILQISYQLINTFWVGRLGADAVAEVSISFPILFLIISLGSGLAGAGSILVSQYAGARDASMVTRVAAQALLVIASTAILFSAMGWLFVPLILSLMHIEAGVANEAESYLRISLCGTIFVFIFQFFQSILRGIGEVRIPLYVVFLSVMLNLLLDPLLIFGVGPINGLGVTGAAWATLTTQCIAATLGIALLFGSRLKVRLQLKDFELDITIIKRIFALGLPAAAEQSMVSIAGTVLTFIVAGFGTVAIASYGLASRMLIFAIIPAFSISIACSTLIGQSMGAGNLRRAKDIALVSVWSTFFLLAGVGLLLYIFADAAVRFFVPSDPILIQNSIVVVQYMALSFGFIGIQQSFDGLFRGTGDTIFPLVSSMISIWMLQIPLAWWLPKYTNLGIDGLWLAYPISSVFEALLAVVWFKIGRWRRPILKFSAKTNVNSVAMI